MAHVVKGRQGILSVAVRQQQKGIPGPLADFLHVQTVPGLHHQRRAAASHLLGHGGVQRSVAGNEVLHLAGALVGGAHHGEDTLARVLRHAVTAHVGHHREAVACHGAGEPQLRAGGAAVHDGVQAPC